MEEIQLRYSSSSSSSSCSCFIFVPLILVTSSSLIFFMLWSSITTKFRKPGNDNKTNPPPSPRRLPIIGNLHQLGLLPHRSFQSLSRKHGPLMLLHYGSAPVLIASSAEAARQIMRVHDLAFADRPQYKVFKKLSYGNKDVVLSNYSDHWRRVKSILVLQLLSTKRVESFRSIREEQTALMIKKIREWSATPVNLTGMFSELTINVICGSAFGSKSENGKKFMQLLPQLMKMFGDISIGDLIPWLTWINVVNGFDRRVDKLAKQLDDFLEAVIEQHMQTPPCNQDDEDNFVDILLQNYNAIGRDSIKALLMDALVGSTDTTSVTLEWIMTELLRHPRVMETLQNEVSEIVRGKHDDEEEEDTIIVITDEDLKKMQYLKAVIKETMRYHPAVPLIIPRVARKDVKVMGYDVAAGTMVMTNAWAIGRDPECWDEPDKFEPGRFLNSDVDLKGLDFELIPFGAGRRGCPGISFAMATIELAIANIVHGFKWELPDGAQAQHLDIAERGGPTTPRAVALLALATPTA